MFLSDLFSLDPFKMHRIEKDWQVAEARVTVPLLFCVILSNKTEIDWSVCNKVETLFQNWIEHSFKLSLFPKSLFSFENEEKGEF